MYVLTQQTGFARLAVPTLDESQDAWSRRAKRTEHGIVLVRVLSSHRGDDSFVGQTIQTQTILLEHRSSCVTFHCRCGSATWGFLYHVN
jgi:hypothetical protein